MNVLFLTMSSGLTDISVNGIYSDLMRKFRDDGHEVYIMYPNERRTGKPTELKNEGGVHALGIKTLNVTRTNIVEKGIGQLLLESQFCAAYKKYFSNVVFDLILYSTPPITFNKVIETVKKKSRGKAICYLLLKDIFPQNAVDLGMMSKNGVKGMLYRLFRKKEKKLYAISDYIGCMSPANVKYVLEHNPDVAKEKVELAPNSCDIPAEESSNNKTDILKKYDLPINKPIFIYGGNMGRPQGIPFLVECMKAVKDRTDCHFVVVGNGTEFYRLEEFVTEYKPKAVSVFQRLPKADYDALAAVCDVGLIFLDYRFTIPNYPSRLLPYLLGHKPIIASTDPNCDTGYLAEQNGYGLYAPSNDVNAFVAAVDKMLASDIEQMGKNGYQFFLDNYTTEHTYNVIMNHLKFSA